MKKAETVLQRIERLGYKSTKKLYLAIPLLRKADFSADMGMPHFWFPPVPHLSAVKLWVHWKGKIIFARTPDEDDKLRKYSFTFDPVGIAQLKKFLRKRITSKYLRELRREQIKFQRFCERHNKSLAAWNAFRSRHPEIPFGFHPGKKGRIDFSGGRLIYRTEGLGADQAKAEPFKVSKLPDILARMGYTKKEAADIEPAKQRVAAATKELERQKRILARQQRKVAEANAALHPL